MSFNGKIKGTYNSTSFSSAGGIWTKNEVMIANKIGQWPSAGAIPTSISDNFNLWLEGDKWNGTTWTATKGTNPTKNGTISSSTVSGKPAALFGSNGYFTISSFIAPSSLAVFAVLQEAASAPLLVEQSTNANSLNGFYYYTDNGYPYNVYRSSVGTQLYINPTSGTEWFASGSLALGATNFDGSTFTLRRNSTTIATTVTGTVGSYAVSTNTTNTLYIGSRAGSALFFNGGYLCELIISPGLNSTDFNTVANYLLTKYSL